MATEAMVVHAKAAPSLQLFRGASEDEDGGGGGGGDDQGGSERGRRGRRQCTFDRQAAVKDRREIERERERERENSRNLVMLRCNIELSMYQI